MPHNIRPDYKASSEFILSGFKAARYEDADMKFLLVTSYTMAVSMIIRASNEGMDITAVASALMSTMNASNVLLVQLDDDVEAKFMKELDEDIRTLEGDYKRLYSVDVDDEELSKMILYSLKITRKIAEKLRNLGIEVERNVVANIE